MGADELNRINDVIYRAAEGKWNGMIDAPSRESDARSDDDMTADGGDVDENLQQNDEDTDEPANKGRMLLDATACPQDIAYPTDLGLLNIDIRRTPTSAPAMLEFGKREN